MISSPICKIWGRKIITFQLENFRSLSEREHKVFKFEKVFILEGYILLFRQNISQCISGSKFRVMLNQYFSILFHVRKVESKFEYFNNKIEIISNGNEADKHNQLTIFGTKPTNRE